MEQKTGVSKCLDCRHYRKIGEVCESDSCVNEKYIAAEVSNGNIISYIAFSSELPKLPKDCKYYEKIQMKWSIRGASK